MLRSKDLEVRVRREGRVGAFAPRGEREEDGARGAFAAHRDGEVWRRVLRDGSRGAGKLGAAEDNQKQFQKEGGMAAIEVMTLSKTRGCSTSRNARECMRVAKMKTAARFAVQMAQAQKDLNRRRQGSTTTIGTGETTTEFDPVVVHHTPLSPTHFRAVLPRTARCHVITAPSVSSPRPPRGVSSCTPRTRSDPSFSHTAR